MMDRKIHVIWRLPRLSEPSHPRSSPSISPHEQHSSHNAANMAPAQDAISAPQVLEVVLLNLPLRQIIKSRAVCREFCHLIDETTSVRRALFLKPSLTDSLLWYPVLRKDHWARGWTHYETDDSLCGWKDGGDANKPTTFPILNPFMPM
jgi:hypothetical protein